MNTEYNVQLFPLENIIMPTYQFEAMDKTGKPIKATIEATDSDDAIKKIKRQGYFPTSVREKRVKGRAGAAAPDATASTKSSKSKKEKAPKPAKTKKKKDGGMAITIGGVKQKEITQFTRQLSTLQDAGLPILRSLQILTEQQKPGKMKQTLTAVQADVEGGSSLSESMAKHPKVFDRLYTKMIAAGEVGGVLDVILQRLADFMEKAERLKRKVIGAMIYPAVVISVAVLIIMGIMVSVVPKFEAIFKDFDTEMPAITQNLIALASWISSTGPNKDDAIPGYLIVIAFPVLVFIAFKIIKKTAVGKQVLDRMKLNLPVLGMLTRCSCIARFSRTLGTLIRAGVPILEAITITRDTIGNGIFEDALQRVHDSIREGDSFAGPLREARIVDALVVNMIDVGEETGDLDKMLIRIADNYDEQVDTAVSSLVSLLEPLMVVGLGLSVGTIVIALFLPMVKLIEGVGG